MHSERPDDEDVDGDHDGGPDRVRREEANVDDRAHHGQDDADCPRPHLAGEECYSGAGDDDAAYDVDPTPGGEVDVDGQSGLSDQEVLVPEEGYKALND